MPKVMLALNGHEVNILDVALDHMEEHLIYIVQEKDESLSEDAEYWRDRLNHLYNIRQKMTSGLIPTK